MVIYTVTQINNQAKLKLENKFSNIWVKGEIISKNTYPTGHTYFTIIDENSELSVVNFNSVNNNHLIQIGKKVILFGKISIYTTKGRFQFISQNIYPEGDGKLWIKFEELKNKLELEGLFNNENKMKIPIYPKSIGLITSEKGVVLWDMINFFKSQNIKLKVIINHASVQGQNSVDEFIEGIDNLNKLNVDIIILARGGGSIEDLWCFNSEVLVRKIFSSKTPIISAIGHETDFTLSDFVADYRAPTPSYAAELITRNFYQLNLDIDNYIFEINHKIQVILKEYKKTFKNISLLLGYKSISNSLNELRQFLYFKMNNLQIKLSFKYNQLLLKMEYYDKLFKSSHPQNILKKGFVIVHDLSDDIISKISNLKLNDKIQMQFQDGLVKAEILKIKKTINEK